MTTSPPVLLMNGIADQEGAFGDGYVAAPLSPPSAGAPPPSKGHPMFEDAADTPGGEWEEG